MKLERVLYSARPPQLNLTIFTSLTLDRLPQLHAQCASYQGPLSAAVFLAVKQVYRDALLQVNAAKVQRAVRAVEAMHAKYVGATSRCRTSAQRGSASQK